MRQIVFPVALLLAGALPGQAFDAQSQAVLDRMKAGKLVHIDDVAALMIGAERWCYREQDGNCAWSDIYLSVEGTDATYEISNPWSEEVDIAFVDRGELRDDRYICEIGFDWIPSVRGYTRSDGNAIEGRALENLRQEIRSQVTVEDNDDCFDYVYRSADAETQVVTLLQRQYIDGETDPANDTEVKLYFDKDAAEALGWYW
ncbi:hypothetical protein SAMN06295905_2929 [Devosia lucknowensis]|uniref:Uncharacterized protein n=1 Tax=Devosia lucknowensis TaxID=1096929 RepID=A0A1Y6G653_9HYPH|nr:hypothetical protein [Devosia lucknowensis]SMQ85642.1 hypothetical protein SAMN06295905_2929 [Devosia lucknowensis]